jgi:hypothetical protein
LCRWAARVVARLDRDDQVAVLPLAHQEADRLLDRHDSAGFGWAGSPPASSERRPRARCGLAGEAAEGGPEIELRRGRTTKPASSTIESLKDTLDEFNNLGANGFC